MFKFMNTNSRLIGSGILTKNEFKNDAVAFVRNLTLNITFFSYIYSL